MNIHKGGCHCGKVRYEVRSDLSGLIECNCSHCAMKGLLLTFVPAADFVLLTGKDDLVEYQFGKKQIHHLYCGMCGVEAFGTGTGRDGSPMVAINVRTIDGIVVADLSPAPFDGKAL